MGEPDLGPVRRVFHIPLRVHSKTNQRIHWTQRNQIAKHERRSTATAWQLHLGRWVPELPCRIHLVRLSTTKRKMDSDNLKSALKCVRDGIADVIGVDDGNETLLQWTYGQEQGRYYEVRVEITTGLPQPTIVSGRCAACGQEVPE